MTILIQIMLNRRLMNYSTIRSSTEVWHAEVTCMLRELMNSLWNTALLLCILQTAKSKSAIFKLPYLLSMKFNLNHYQFILFCIFYLIFYFSFTQFCSWIEILCTADLHTWHSLRISLLIIEFWALCALVYLLLISKCITTLQYLAAETPLFTMCFYHLFNRMLFETH